MTSQKLTGQEIAAKITSDVNFKAILKAYKSDKTKGYAYEFENKNANGLSESFFGIELDQKLICLIVPLFCTSKTITFNFSYFNVLRSVLPKHYAELQDHELVNLIQCPLYYLDEDVQDIQFLSLVNLKDWINDGMKGKNANSVYYWIDKLPNKNSISKKQLKSHVFVKLLSSYTSKELKTLCIEYATAFHKQFADINQRSEITKIKNIATGLYAQIKTYLYLKDSGYAVSMEWDTNDDYLGIDITFTINDTRIAIDVKSTKDDDLKISKNKKETDFYAVCTWTKSEPQLLGFLFKYNFWKSEIINTTMPLKKRDDLYYKPLKDIKKDLVNIDKLYTVIANYNKLKMKKGERLFNVE